MKQILLCGGMVMLLANAAMAEPAKAAASTLRREASPPRGADSDQA